MIVKRGNFLAGLQAPGTLVAAPTNGVLTSRGLVMGAGAVKALAEAEPRLPRLFAEAVQREGILRNGVYLYGFVAVEAGGRCKQLGNSAHFFTPALTCSHFPPPHPSEPPRHTKSPEALYSPTGGPR